MVERAANFTVRFDGPVPREETFAKDGIVLGRIPSCDVTLDHASVSRLHAGVNYLDSRFFVINLSGANFITLNGRKLAPGETDVLVDGDLMIIGPFAVVLAIDGSSAVLSVRSAADSDVLKMTRRFDPDEIRAASAVDQGQADVLKVFWEKRSRDKEDWGTRLRPSERPVPGKARINWKPTKDLRQAWRIGVFLWAITVLGALAVFAYIVSPDTYAPMPLSRAHASAADPDGIAAAPNADSCMTCHLPDAPMDTACASCHIGENFHASNIKAHKEAGVGCTECHTDHRGSDFDLNAAAKQTCAACHRDGNRTLYNGKSVATPHNGGFNYPVASGRWVWKGVQKELAVQIPEVNGSASGDRDEQEALTRQFHAVHVGRLKVPEGLKGDRKGLVSCSTCHRSFDPIDVETPVQTCAACHGGGEGPERVARAETNCVSCHVQHPFSTGRWSDFLTPDALERRRAAAVRQIAELKSR